MGDVYVSTGAGGGTSSDDVTVTRDKVLAGYTALTADSGDEPANGAMPNNGAQNATLNCGQSHVIPSGYTSGGTITASSLASQTGGATADTSKVLSGYTFWRDGAKHTGILTVSSVVSFNVAQYSNLTLIASWAKPSKGPWSGIRVICKQGGYPSNASDGTLFYEGSGISATKSLAAGTWYFRAWNYITTSQGRIYGGYADKAATNNQIRGQQVFTSSGTFTVPAMVSTVDVFVVGGGGGGGASNLSSVRSGSGGGGGYTNYGRYSVTPGQSYYVTIGAGGAAAPVLSSNRFNGGTSAFGNLISASGGQGGAMASSGGSGGSGGGGSVRWTNGIDGGSNGADGAMGSDGNAGGNGQHTTTRAFGESSNTLYAGGGGSGGASYDYPTAGNGGAGGGGAGGFWTDGNPGVANTGGGGGGSPVMQAKNEPNRPGSAGGSGIVIVRWGY